MEPAQTKLRQGIGSSSAVMANAVLPPNWISNFRREGYAGCGYGGNSKADTPKNAIIFHTFLLNREWAAEYLSCDGYEKALSAAEEET